MKKKINKKEIYVLLGILGAIMIICINLKPKFTLEIKLVQ